MPTNSLDAAVARLEIGRAGPLQGPFITVSAADVQVVLAALERLRPAPRWPRKDLVSTFRASDGAVAAHCPDCRRGREGARMFCLSTRRPRSESGMVRRRWECHHCKKRFTSYTHEKE